MNNLLTLLTEKQCPKCSVTRPVDQFHKNRSRSDGLAVWCKPCKQKHRDEYGARVAALVAVRKICTCCKKDKLLSEYLKSKHHPYGVHSRCYECEVAARKRTGCTVSVETKRCCRCKVEKPSSEFHTNKSRPDGLHCWCRECNRWREIKTNHGISRQEYERLFLAQNGLCAICKKPSLRRLHVDHSHATGTIRGLLCGVCNRGIGLFGDNIKSLKAAARYLEKSL